MARHSQIRKPAHKWVAIPIVLWLALGLPTAAGAHPLGNFTINHYAGLQISRTSVTVDYVLDMAEIPAFQEISAFDANGNDLPDPSEASAFHPAQCRSSMEKVRLRADGQPAPRTCSAAPWTSAKSALGWEGQSNPWWRAYPPLQRASRLH